jgi:hypothetical protein
MKEIKQDTRPQATPSESPKDNKLPLDMKTKDLRRSQQGFKILLSEPMKTKPLNRFQKQTKG